MTNTRCDMANTECAMTNTRCDVADMKCDMRCAMTNTRPAQVGGLRASGALCVEVEDYSHVPNLSVQ